MAQDIVQRSGLLHITRRLAAVAVLLALVAALLPGVTPTAEAQDAQAAGTVTIQALGCPNDYAGEDYLSDCTTPFALPVSVTDPAGSTVSLVTDGLADGIGTFAAGVAGTYTVSYGFENEGRPVYYFACFDGADVFLFDGTETDFTVDLAADESLFCRIYTSYLTIDAPVTASADFQVFVCPVDYTGHEYLADCDTVDPDNLIGALDVSLSAGADLDPDTALIETTGDDGRLQFDAIAAGTYTFGLDVPDVNGSFYLACFDATSGAEVFLFNGAANQFTADIAQGGALSCRWYVIPETIETPNDSASATFTVLLCPAVGEGAEDYLDDCVPYAEPVELALSASVPFDPTDVISSETDVDGVASFIGLEAGDYSAAALVTGDVTRYRIVCVDPTAAPGAEVLFNDEQLVNAFAFDLVEGGAIDCSIYVIPPAGDTSVAPSASPSAIAASVRPSASSGPVVTLPSTGTGADGTGGLDSVALPLVALLMAALVAAAVLATRRVGLTH